MSTPECIFRGAYVREQIDPRVQAEWKARFGKGARFGFLRQTWREQHCSRINPYGGECPYSEAECGTAFLVAVQRALAMEDPESNFVARARSYGIDRADNKPLSRDRIRTDGPQGPGHAGGARSGVAPGLQRDDGGPHQGLRPSSERGAPGHAGPPNVRRSDNRPVPVGDLLRALDLGPRQRPTTSSEEGTK